MMSVRVIPDGGISKKYFFVVYLPGWIYVCLYLFFKLFRRNLVYRFYNFFYRRRFFDWREIEWYFPQRKRKLAAAPFTGRFWYIWQKHLLQNRSRDYRDNNVVIIAKWYMFSRSIVRKTINYLGSPLMPTTGS